jgi:hypothetical protein
VNCWHPQAIAQVIIGAMRTFKPLVTIDHECPKPSTIAAVQEAAGHCLLDPAATPRSNQARLLFALYYCIGLPFPRGWREACVSALAGRGIPADILALDMIYSAMALGAADDFLGWPGIDDQLVRDLMDRSRVCGDRL